MSKRDYYEVLGVSTHLQRRRLKAAFRKLAMQHHPDRNPGDNECEHRFKELNEAYEVLKDGDKRAAYDRFGHAAFEQGGMGGGAHGFGADFAHHLFRHLRRSVRHGRRPARRRRRQGRERGSDLRYNMEIGLEEAFAGKTAQIRIPTSVICEACSGTGAKAGTKPKTCATCGGAGKIRHAQGFFTLERTCPACQGRGQVIENPCPSCAGSGRVTRERNLSVNIPAGVEDGTRIRLAGEGEAGPARRTGRRPLYFSVARAARVLPARRRRSALPGADLHGHRGDRRRIRGAGHRRQQAKVKVPAGTQTGRRFRLSGKGMPVLRSKQTGDMYVQVSVETPQNLTKRQRELLAEFEKLSSEATQPESAGFFSRGQGFSRWAGKSGQPSRLAILTPPPWAPIPVKFLG